MNPATPVQGEIALPIKPISPATIVFAVLLCLLSISAMVRWYAREVSLPRYCANPQQSVALLKRIIVNEKPVPETASRTPYMVAAKLMFLVPRAAEEPLDTYLSRVEADLQNRCANNRFAAK